MIGCPNFILDNYRLASVTDQEVDVVRFSFDTGVFQLEVFRLLYNFVKKRFEVFPVTACWIDVIQQSMEKAAVQIDLVACAPQRGKHIERFRTVCAPTFM